MTTIRLSHSGSKYICAALPVTVGIGCKNNSQDASNPKNTNNEPTKCCLKMGEEEGVNLFKVHYTHAWT
jgi:hypothetical protein